MSRICHGGDPIEVDAGTILAVEAADRERLRSPPAAHRPAEGATPMAIGHAASVCMLEARYAAASVA